MTFWYVIKINFENFETISKVFFMCVCVNVIIYSEVAIWKKVYSMNSKELFMV